MNVLVDTSAWYALSDHSDRHHKRATGCVKRISESLMTTDAVVVETFSLLTSRLGRDYALRFWETLRHTSTPILCLEPIDVERAWHIARDYADQTFSFTDTTTFAAMERIGITRCFTFDRHFSVYRYGPRRKHSFVVLPDENHET